MTTKKAQKELQIIADDYTNSELKRTVAEMIIGEVEGYDKADDWFNDLLSHGCVSGMVGGLIYYTDTYKFYDDNYSDIEDLRAELSQMYGEDFNVPGDQDLKNWWAWCAFEETSRQIASDLGIEV